MKALLIGSGARENAILDALVACGVDVYAFMSNRNPGIYRYCKEFVVGSITDVESIKKFAGRIQPDVAVIGPEAPLGVGVVDGLEKIGIGCFGPNKFLAQLETSKAFTRNILEKYKIPGNPKFRIFSKNNKSEIRKFIADLGEFVVKPDGLTGGKGVKVSGEHLSGIEAGVDYCVDVLETHPNVIVEEKLDGEEFSLQSITDGKTVIDCPPVQDHKRAFDGDTGGNTGGMGSYSCADHLLPFLRKEDVEQAHEITVRVADALRKEHGLYKGVMYGGFMLTKNGVRLIEYNARFGDPEAMNVLPILKTPFLDVCNSVVDGSLDKLGVKFENWATVCKYVVPKGYPDSPVSGRIDIPQRSDALRFYAAVDEREGAIYTTKSRAVAFVGISKNFEEAEALSEFAASSVRGDVFHRQDIGTRQLLEKRILHMKNVFGVHKSKPLRIAAFMSGSGTNLRRILELQKKYSDQLFKVVVIFTDTKDESRCNAGIIADECGIPLLVNDIMDYYSERGHSSKKDMAIRSQFDSETAAELKKRDVQIVALCGYMSLVTAQIYKEFITINVHPADLTRIDKSGKRLYAGCAGHECIKKAILAHDSEVRSTVHLVNGDLDGGPVIAVSQPVKVISNYSSEQALDAASRKYQDELKQKGDWMIYPKVISMLAEGRITINGENVFVDGVLVKDGIRF